MFSRGDRVIVCLPEFWGEEFEFRQYVDRTADPKCLLLNRDRPPGEPMGLYAFESVVRHSLRRRVLTEIHLDIPEDFS